ncbi:MAG: hypothetical protein KatS3mg087_0436 [Patescibacteria group bacterium]|nr:MAG: hypothetical protein KatS3mg087_0436 [Patescibacteria group bacterium]
MENKGSDVRESLLIDTIMSLQLNLERLMFDSTFKSVDNQLAVLSYLLDEMGYDDSDFLVRGYLSVMEFKDLIFRMQQVFGEFAPKLFASLSSRLEQLTGENNASVQDVVNLFKMLSENLNNLENLSKAMDDDIQAMRAADNVDELKNDVEMGIMEMIGESEEPDEAFGDDDLPDETDDVEEDYDDDSK